MLILQFRSDVYAGIDYRTSFVWYKTNLMKRRGEAPFMDGGIDSIKKSPCSFATKFRLELIY